VTTRHSWPAGGGAKGAAGIVDVAIVRADRTADGMLASAGEAVVVIDVIRAFTTAAILLARGASYVACVSDAEQARRLARDAASGHLVVGEQEDPPFPHVDLPNSPTAVLAAEVRDRAVTLFTVNGTRALVRIPAEATVLGGAIVNARATAGWILANRPGVSVRLVVTDPHGPEDLVCAVYMSALLTGHQVCDTQTRSAVTAAAYVHARRWGAQVSRGDWLNFLADVQTCAQVNAVPVVLLGDHDGSGQVVLRRGVTG
jgi:2-phosphosulfolactate phosphatase